MSTLVAGSCSTCAYKSTAKALLAATAALSAEAGTAEGGACTMLDLAIVTSALCSAGALESEPEQPKLLRLDMSRAALDALNQVREVMTR
ncbi:MAG TPA: hypothetical protein VHW01_19170 [Polyangiaceae bacterium]|nr:hypothetical protein [Polyangiaceae bacterium]